MNTLHTEGLDLCLHARHQSNIGCFVQPRVSDGVHDQVGKGDKFELELQRKFLAVLILQQTFNSFFQDEISHRTGLDLWLQGYKSLHLLV